MRNSNNSPESKIIITNVSGPKGKDRAKQGKDRAKQGKENLLED
jgi:hypothetical protein